MLRIGNVTLATNLLLAPIAGYCDLAFRLVCRSVVWEPSQGGDGRGLGLACTDLLSPQGLLRGTATSLDLARTNDLDKPVGMQLYGADPAIMADGARWARDHGATIIDINMGCPVDKVTKKDGGSKLLCDPERAVRIVEHTVAAVAASGVPVTAKMRLGWFNDQPVAEWLAPRLVDAGVAAITVHGRTTEQRFTGTVNHEGIRRVVEAVGGRVPVIGNGDVKEPQDVLEMIRRTGCQGVMIGRGALSTPWIFRDAWALQNSGTVPEPPSEADRIALVRRYFELMLEFRGERYAMTQIRRRITWFAKRLGPCKPLREAVRLAPDPAAVHAALDAFLAGGLRSRAGEADDPETPESAAGAMSAGAAA
jgi:tRNA-dihydrouridine synthase B